jgi:hypothetical protein
MKPLTNLRFETRKLETETHIGRVLGGVDEAWVGDHDTLVSKRRDHRRLLLAESRAATAVRSGCPIFIWGLNHAGPRP